MRLLICCENVRTSTNSCSQSDCSDVNFLPYKVSVQLRKTKYFPVLYLDKLVKINNKLPRILQNQPVATPVSQLYTSFNLLSIDTLHVLQILLLVFNLNACTIVIWFHQYILTIFIVLNNEIHNYNTRLSQGLHICGPRTSFGQKCVHFKGSSLLNRLPSSLKIPFFCCCI